MLIAIASAEGSPMNDANVRFASTDSTKLRSIAMRPIVVRHFESAMTYCRIMAITLIW